MKFLAHSDLNEYMKTYIERDFSKSSSVENLEKLTDRDWVKREMGCRHIGKIDKGIFWDGKWTKYEIEDRSEIENVVCLEGGSDHWTTKNLIQFPKVQNYRILSTYVQNAKNSKYFEKTIDELGKTEYDHRMHYFEKFRGDGFAEDFTGLHRIVFRRTTAGEHQDNPNATYYLHDGFGRMLPLFYLITFENLPIPKIEVLVVEPNNCEYF